MSNTISSDQPEASTSTSGSASASPLTTRTTGRTRVKSQRVLEAEDTKRYLLNQAHAQVPPQPHAASESSAHGAKAVTYGKKAKGKGKKNVENEVYCICKTNNEGSMIECGECNDWFHFTCIGLTDDEAEKIHVYVCPECTETTDKKTTYKYDISTFPSPSPPPGVVPAKRKANKVRKAEPSRTPEDNDSSDSESEVEVPASSSSRHSSIHHTPPPNKKPRGSIDAKRKPSILVDRKPSIDRKPSSSAGLPPMRKYVREKLVPLFKGIFGEMEGEEVEKYSVEVEEGIYNNFREVVNGKQTAGNRYKTQFNLLSSSIVKGLRPDLIASITSRDLSPLQIATLTPADLATEEQLAAIQRAKQAVLEQTVKSKEDLVSSSIRLGRDGFEKVENAREKEMNLLAEQEELARLKQEEELRKKESQPVIPEPEKSPLINDLPKFTHAPKRSESFDVSSPLRQASFVNSAWTGNTPKKDDEEISVSNFDQSNLDLSDIIDVEGDMDIELDDVLGGGKVVEEKEQSEMEIFESKEIVWSGRINNPANPSTHIPPISLRVICRAPPMDFNLLLPHKTIEITGRVPTANSLQYLSDNRLNPTKELIIVAFSIVSKATDDEILAWEEMVEYHIGRDRHAIYLPYGNHPPPGAAKELYLIPLRPTDPSPEFTELIDGYSLPTTGRSTSVFLGAFVANKITSSTPVPVQSTQIQNMPTPIPIQPTPIQNIPTPPLPAPQVIPSVPASIPVIQNDQLQALMATLNPIALANLAGGVTPNLGGTTPPIGNMTPMAPPPIQQQSYPYYPVQGSTPYPPSEYAPYEHQGNPPYPQQGHQGSWANDRRDPRRRGDERRGERRDNGWGNRGKERRY